MSKKVVKTISSTEAAVALQLIFPNANIGPSIMVDATYALFTPQYIRGPLSRGWKAWAMFNRIWNWTTKHDCDNKANCHKAYSNICFAFTKMRTKADGVAVFNILFHSDKLDGGHAINVHLQPDGDYIIYEPQLAREIYLTEKERLSTWGVY